MVIDGVHYGQKSIGGGGICVPRPVLRRRMRLWSNGRGNCLTDNNETHSLILSQEGNTIYDDGNPPGVVTR